MERQVRAGWGYWAIAILSLAASQGHQWMAGMPPSMITPGMLAMQAVIWIVLLFLIWFAVRARKSGILR